MRNDEVFQKCSFRLSKLENILTPFDFSKRARVLVKKLILQPKVKIHSKIEKMFHKNLMFSCGIFTHSHKKC